MRVRQADQGVRWFCGAVAFGLFALVGCGGPEGTTPGGVAADASSGFTVGAAPAGYRATVAGRGSWEQDWGQDSGGTQEPYTVLSRDGSTDGDDVVVVSTTGFEGLQGGLDGAVWRSGDEAQAFTIDGREARFNAGGETDYGLYWAQLMVVQGDDLAVRITTPSATRDELVAMLELVEVPDDRTKPPAMPNPPNGLQVVGSVDAAALLALSAYVPRNSDLIPGTDAAHAVGWEGPQERDSLSVLTIPGSAADLAALVVDGHVADRDGDAVAEDLDVGGRPARSLETLDPDGGWSYRSVWVESDWGDLVVVAAVGPSTPAIEALAELAATVEPVDDATWEEFAVAVTGGPSLRPDPGRNELARGTIGDLEWLLQDAPQEDLDAGSASDRMVDPCLKLSNRERTCNSPEGGSGTIDEWFFVADEGIDGLPPFVVLSTTLEAALVQVTTRTDEARAGLVAVPGGGLWAAVIFVDDPGDADGVCDEGPAFTAPPEGAFADMRVDALDASGQVIGCLGLGPGSHVGGI